VKVLIAVCALVAFQAMAIDPVQDLKKAAKEEGRVLKNRMKKYGIKETGGTRVIGISREYYVINGKQVLCSDVEFKCVDGKCELVLKK
jgi:hypothetical protein